MTRRNRSSQAARRFLRAGRAFLRLDFGRAVSPSISTSIRPSGAPALIVANSFGRTLHLRKTALPDDQQAVIYHAMGITPPPRNVRKTCDSASGS